MIKVASGGPAKRPPLRGWSSCTANSIRAGPLTIHSWMRVTRRYTFPKTAFPSSPAVSQGWLSLSPVSGYLGSPPLPRSAATKRSAFAKCLAHPSAVWCRPASFRRLSQTGACGDIDIFSVGLVGDQSVAQRLRLSHRHRPGHLRACRRLHHLTHLLNHQLPIDPRRAGEIRRKV